jgi:hypothetical protein
LKLEASYDTYSYRVQEEHTDINANKTRKAKLKC